MNGGPKRGPDLTDNHGIASRPQGPGRQSPRSRPRPKGDRTQGFPRNGVTRMSPSAPFRLEALRKCRSCVWRAGCTKTCLSGSGGGGWIPLLPRGWPPTSSQDRFWQDLPDSGGRIPGTPGPHRDSRRRLVGPPEPLDEAGQFEEIGHAGGGANHGGVHDGIGRRQAGPLGRQGHELAVVIDEEGAVLAPVVPVGQEGEVPPVQRMEGWVTWNRRDGSSGSGASGYADQWHSRAVHTHLEREPPLGALVRHRGRT